MDTGKTEPPISAARGTRIVEQRPIRIGASGDHHKPYTAEIMFNNIERTYPSVVADADHTQDARPTRSGDTSPGNLGFQFQHRPGIGGIVMGTTPTRQPTIGVTDHGIVGGTDLRSNDVGGTNVGGTNRTPNAGHCTPNVKPNVWGTHHRQTNRTPNVRGTDHTPDIGRTDQGIDHRGRETVSAEATDHWPTTVRKIRSDLRAERKETPKETYHRRGSGDLAVPQQVPETEPERMVNSKLSSTGHDSEGELKAGVKHVAMVPLRNKKQQMQVTYTAGESVPSNGEPSMTVAKPRPQSLHLDVEVKLEDVTEGTDGVDMAAGEMTCCCRGWFGKRSLLRCCRRRGDERKAAKHNAIHCCYSSTKCLMVMPTMMLLMLSILIAIALIVGLVYALSQE